MGLFGPSKKELARRESAASAMERQAHESSEEAREADRIAEELERTGDHDLAAVQRAAAGEARWSTQRHQAEAQKVRCGR